MIAAIFIAALALLGAWTASDLITRITDLETLLRRTRREHHEWTQHMNDRITGLWEGIVQVEELAKKGGGNA